MTNSKVLLAIDAGGTFFKYGVYKPDGVCCSGVRKEPSHSDGSAEEILESYRRMVEFAAQFGTVAAIGVSTPGPFDYAAGKSMMRQKYPALYGVELGKTVSGFAGGVPVSFYSDSNAFLMGEYTNETDGAENVIGVTLGTGLGFAVICGGRLVTNAVGGPAERLFDRPYRGKTVEDFVSARGLANLYGEALTALEIAKRAEQGEERAQRAYREMGTALGEILQPFLTKYRAEKILCGGQISRSFALFGDALQKAAGVAAKPVSGCEDAALKGVFQWLRPYLQE